MKTKIKPSLDLKSDERFLFEKLPDVVRLEAAMQGVRAKYLRFWDDIYRRVRSEHPALKFFGNHATRPRDGQVGIGRDCWLTEWARWPSGFYICAIDFESLCSPDAGTPCAGMWLQPLERMRI